MRFNDIHINKFQKQRSPIRLTKNWWDLMIYILINFTFFSFQQYIAITEWNYICRYLVKSIKPQFLVFWFFSKKCSFATFTWTLDMFYRNIFYFDHLIYLQLFMFVRVWPEDLNFKTDLWEMTRMWVTAFYQITADMCPAKLSI